MFRCEFAAARHPANDCVAGASLALEWIPPAERIPDATAPDSFAESDTRFRVGRPVNLKFGGLTGVVQ
jgi:hypothetical protein